VRYYARVVDNGPAAQEARTREYVLRMPGTAELRRAAGERLEGAVGRGRLEGGELVALADGALRLAGLGERFGARVHHFARVGGELVGGGTAEAGQLLLEGGGHGGLARRGAPSGDEA